MDNKKFVEIKKPVEEIREIEEVKLEVPKVEKVEVAKETSTPQETPNESERIEEGLKDMYGASTAASEETIYPALKVVGKAEKGIGKITDKESFKAAGRVQISH